MVSQAQEFIDYDQAVWGTIMELEIYDGMLHQILVETGALHADLKEQ
jgi:hypothetical protein